MFRRILGIVLAFFLAAGASLPMARVVHAGAAPIGPTVEWNSPTAIVYGGRPVSTSAYLYNPTRETLRFTASAWFNSQAIETERFRVFLVNASWENLMGIGHSCDESGCKYVATGSVAPGSRVFAVFGMYSGRNLGQNLTVGSVTVKFEGQQTQLYAEGRANLVEGQEFSVTLEPDQLFSPQGGYLQLVVKVTDRTLNNFQLLGVGATCSSAIVPDVSFYRPWVDTTLAQWMVTVYIPDAVVDCTITVLVKTKDTVIARSYTRR